jgi:integrase
MAQTITDNLPTVNSVVGGSNPSRLISVFPDGRSSVIEEKSTESGANIRVQNIPYLELQKYKAIVRSRDFLNSLAKHDLIELIGLLSRERARRYRRRKDRKYGNINKGFTEDELENFFACCTHPKAKLAFQMQGYLGLRIGEVVQVRLDDIDFIRRRIKVQTEKARTGDALYLHDRIYEPLKNWVDEHAEAIAQSGGFILFSSNINRHEPHISAHWLRKAFREAAMLAGLNEHYGRSDETAADKRQRKLYRLTTHSLRHHFISSVYRATKDPVVAQKVARHRDLKSTSTYIYSTQQDTSRSPPAQ